MADGNILSRGSACWLRSGGDGESRPYSLLFAPLRAREIHHHHYGAQTTGFNSIRYEADPVDHLYDTGEKTPHVGTKDLEAARPELSPLASRGR